MTKVTLIDRAIRDSLTPRKSPYWHTVMYGRHVGYQKLHIGRAWWLARVRTRAGGYRQTRLAPASEHIGFSEALRLAEGWFSSESVQDIASSAIPVGATQHLKYKKTVDGFTVGDALHDYVEWKRIAAARSHFETVLSLINHHIIPRLGDVLVRDLTSRRFTAFCRDVLETPPKRGNQKPGPRRKLEEQAPEDIRKRKKTVNTLTGILRLALRLAWENGETDERAWMRLRRLPHADVPRQVFLSRDECSRLVACCRDDLALLVKGALYTGCRVTELTGLKVGDVGDFCGLWVSGAKNYRRRAVYLPEEGMEFFSRLCRGRNPHEYVFLMNARTKWTSSYRHLFREAVARAGVTREMVFHGLRHTYASQLVQSGASLSLVARQLGHATTDTVSRTYGHLSSRMIESELDQHFEPLNRPGSERTSGGKPTMQSEATATSIGWPRSNFSAANDSNVVMFRRFLEIAKDH